MPEQLTTTVGTLWTGLTSTFTRFMNFVPQLLAGFILLVAGWFISKFAGKLVERLLLNAKLEWVLGKSHINDYLPTSGSGKQIHISSFVGGAVKWFLFLIFVQAAAITIGIVQLSGIINNIILFIPNIIAAVAILVLGAWASNTIAGIIEISTTKMGLKSPNMPSLLGRYGILGLAVIAAVSQLGVATNLINILFTGLVAALSLAFALAFGLGGQEAASDITRHWLRQSQSPPKLSPGDAETPTEDHYM